jgi:hypothetical protein
VSKLELKERVKAWLKEFRENFILVLIGSFLANLPLLWYLYFIEIINLASAIMLTLFYPIAIVLIYYGERLEDTDNKLFFKIIMMVIGGVGFGGIIWFLSGYLLLQAPWAPFHTINPSIRGRLLLFLLIPSFIVGACVMYKIGESKNWKPGTL